MATKTEICNQALVLIGSTFLSDFATDTSKAGQYCRLFYDTTVDELLEMYPWDFALKRKLLTTPLQDVPLWEFDHAYQLPEDCLDVLETDLQDEVWKQEGRLFLSNNDSVSIIYLARVEDTSLYSTMFRQTLIYLMAAKLAVPVARSDKLATLNYQLAVQTLGQSEHLNSAQNNEAYAPDALIDVRIQR